MPNINRKKLEKIIYKLLIIEGKTKIILKKELLALNLTQDEMNYVAKLMIENRISLEESEIVKKYRSTLVSKYEYGNIAGYEIGYLDKPVMATLEYNEFGDLIYADFSKLDEYLENVFIPNHIIKKSVFAENNKYYIRLYDLLRLQLNEEEVKHTMEYLNRKGIFVRGRSSVLDGEFENYDYYDNYQNLNTNLKPSSDDITEKLLLYKKNPSLELRNEIVILNISLVEQIAYEFCVKTGFNRYELESYGYEGLIDAVEDFDISLGYKFSTYAASIIRGKIMGGIPTIVGYNRGKFYNNFYNAKRTVEKDLQLLLKNSPEIVDDIVGLLVENDKISAGNAENIKNKILLHMPDSLSDYIDVIDDNSNYNDDIEECLEQDNLLYLNITRNIVSKYVKEMLDTLTERELKLIVGHYGLDGNEPKTFQELGEELGVSRQAAEQFKKRILKRLANSNNAKYLKSFIEEYDRYNYEPNLIFAYQKKDK